MKKQAFTQKNIKRSLSLLGIVFFWIIIFIILSHLLPPIILWVRDDNIEEKAYIEIYGFNLGNKNTSSSVIINGKAIEDYKIVFWNLFHIGMTHELEDAQKLVITVKTKQKSSNRKIVFLKNVLENNFTQQKNIYTQDTFQYDEYEYLLAKNKYSYNDKEEIKPFAPLEFENNKNILGKWELRVRNDRYLLSDSHIKKSATIEQVYLPDVLWFNVDLPYDIQLVETGSPIPQEFEITLSPMYSEFNLQKTYYSIILEYNNPIVDFANLLPLVSSYQNGRLIQLNATYHLGDNYFFESDQKESISMELVTTYGIWKNSENIPIPVFYNKEKMFKYLFETPSINNSDLELLGNLFQERSNELFSIPSNLTLNNVYNFFSLPDSTRLPLQIDSKEQRILRSNMRDYLQLLIQAFSTIELPLLRQMSFYPAIQEFPISDDRSSLAQKVLLAKFLRRQGFVARTIVGMELNFEEEQQVVESYKYWVEVLTRSHGWLTLENPTAGANGNTPNTLIYSIGKENSIAGFIFEEYFYLLQNKQNPNVFSVKGFSKVRQ